MRTIDLVGGTGLSATSTLGVPQLRAATLVVPAIIADVGDRATYRFLEFFTANIRNKNTRAAYARALTPFLAWCEKHGRGLAIIDPVSIAAYIEQLGTTHSKPTVKQHLAAIRMLFDWMVTGGILPFNPASSVRGPKYVVKKGKTPVLSPEEARALLDSIDVTDLSGLRDRALIAVMVYSFARVSAVIGMNVEDYYQQGKRWWLRLHEKGGKHHEVPAHHNAEEYLDAYIEAASLAGQKGVTPPMVKNCTLRSQGRFARLRGRSLRFRSPAFLLQW